MHHCFEIQGMTKVKMTKEETGPSDFVEKRRAALERYKIVSLMLFIY
jgi:hypothetical protein